MTGKKQRPDPSSSRKPCPRHRARQWISSGLEKLAERITSSPNNQTHFDITIIGSGYGGSIAASELSNQTIEENGRTRPLRICVLERGKEFLPGSFPREMAELPSELRLRTSSEANLSGSAGGLYDIRMGKDVGVLLGNGLGGGSLINAGVMEVPTSDVFDEYWPALIRNADSGEMEKLFSDTKSLLGASIDKLCDNTIHQHATFQKSSLSKYTSLKSLSKSSDRKSAFRAAAVTIAMSDKLSSGKVQLSECTLCGDCATGCNHNAKESLDTNLLHKAWVNGVDIYTGTTVLKISRNNAAWEIDLVYTDHKIRRREENNNNTNDGIIKLKTGKVIIAAGTLGSTEILLKSMAGIGLENANIGKRFSSNGDMLAAGCDMNEEVNAVADEETAPNKRFVGPTCTGVIDLREAENRAGTVIEELAVPGPLSRIYEELFITSNTLHDFDSGNYKNHSSGQPEFDPFSISDQRRRRLAIYAVISDDKAQGEMFLGKNSASYAQDGNIHIHWPDLKNQSVFEQQIRTLKKMNTASNLGGRIIPNPGWSPIPESMAFLFDNDKGALFTVHPLGGCAMGDSIHSAVVDHYGRVFKSQNSGHETFDDLVILDGSIIPTAIGINPALTIAAVSLRAIRGLKAAWNLTDNPENIFDVSSPVPRPFFRDCSKAVDKKQTTVEIMERLTGKVDFLDKNGFSQSRHMELTLYFDAMSIKELIRPAKNTSTTHTQPRRIIKISESSPNSALKIYGPDYDPQALVSTEPEYRARIHGQLEIFQRKKSSAIGRISSAFYAWLLNRGLRDITQAAFKKPWEKARIKTSLIKKVSNGFNRAIKTLHIASRAGEIRLFEYRLNTSKIDSTSDKIYNHLQRDFAFTATKTISYTRRSNPWRQLMQATISEFPAPLKQHPPPRLTLDLDFLTQNKTPLLRIKQQNDQVNALVDVFSIITYITRLIISIHLWSFPKPDTWQKRKPTLLAGPLPGIQREPEITYLPLHNRLKPSIPHAHSTCRLTYYAGANKIKTPIMLIHGYSTSSTTFAHPSIPNNLVTQLHNEGRDVWLLDLRTSIGMEHTCNKPWSFETTAGGDIPLALDHIYKIENRSIHVLAHCIGGAMMSMAILGDFRPPKHSSFNPPGQKPVSDFYTKRIASIILSQVGPYIHFSPANVFRAYLTNYFLSLFETGTYEFRPENANSLGNQLMDRLLSSLPYPEEEFHKEYPVWPPWKRTSFTGLRHRMDLLYGRTFNIANIKPAVLDSIDDIFGPPNLQTIAQTIHLARYGVITNRKGYNQYTSLSRLKKHWKFPTCLVHGKENGLSDVKTLWELEKQLTAAHCVVSPAEPIPDAGHQDCYIGEGVSAVGKKIIKYLSTLEMQESNFSGKIKGPRTTVRIYPPWLGPVWTASSALTKTQPEEYTLTYQLALGVAPDHIKPDMLLPIPVTFNKDNNQYTPCSNNPIELITQLIENFNNKTHPIQYTKNSYWFHTSFELPAPGDQCAGILCLPVYQNHDVSGVIDTRTKQHLANTVLNEMRNTANEILEQALIPVVNSKNSSLKFAIGSCQYPANPMDQIPAYHSYHRLANRLKADTHLLKPDFVILTGDQVYTDASAGICDPATIHNRFNIPYYRWLENQDVRYVLRNLPAYMMLDDHEVEDNYEPGNLTKKQDGYFKHGKDAYLNFQRGHWPPENKGNQLWNSFEQQGFGFFMLDTRSDRTPRSNKNHKTSQIISKKQWSDLEAWLSEQSQNTKPKFIVSPSMPFPRRVEVRDFPEVAIHLDNWSGYPASLRDFLKLLVKYKAENLILISGDEHISNVTTITTTCQTSSDQYTFHSVHSSGLYSPFPFANAIKEDFSRQDSFSFENSQGEKHLCQTHCTFFPGDGFAIINTLRKEGADWELYVEFLRGEEGEDNLPVNIKTLETKTAREK